ncbi:MAG: class I SAM-dependent methyltransferase [Bacilli bacterium]|nr:class I SAM-dependent methyltransferase [Bacilli bacterium]
MSNKKSASVLNTFEKMAKQYVDYFGDDWEFKKEIEEFSSLFSKKSTIIDLGSGSGYITSFLKEKDLNAIGIDFSKEMINIAQKRYPSIKFINDDFLNLENHFQESTIDGAISIYSFYFIPKELLNDFLKHLSYVMKNNAKLYIITIIGEGEKMVITPLMQKNNIEEDIYVNYYKKEQLIEILNNNNFSVDYIKEASTIDDNDISQAGKYLILATNKK